MTNGGSENENQEKANPDLEREPYGAANGEQSVDMKAQMPVSRSAEINNLCNRLHEKRSKGVALTRLQADLLAAYDAARSDGYYAGYQLGYANGTHNAWGTNNPTETDAYLSAQELCHGLEVHCWVNPPSPGATNSPSDIEK